MSEALVFIRIFEFMFDWLFELFCIVYQMRSCHFSRSYAAVVNIRTYYSFLLLPAFWWIKMNYYAELEAVQQSHNVGLHTTTKIVK